MFRRSFMQSITLASAGVGIGAGRRAEASEKKTVRFRVKGFSCVTCAIGLDTVLRQHKGVIESRSSYPDATTVIEFNPELVTEKGLKEWIAELGFTAEREQQR